MQAFRLAAYGVGFVLPVGAISGGPNRYEAAVRLAARWSSGVIELRAAFFEDVKLADPLGWALAVRPGVEGDSVDAEVAHVILGGSDDARVPFSCRSTGLGGLDAVGRLLDIATSPDLLRDVAAAIRLER